MGEVKKLKKNQYFAATYTGSGLKMPKLPGRNEKCPCGSGKKFKSCHLDAVEAPMRAAVVSASRETQRVKEEK